MDIYLEGPEGMTILTFYEKTVISCQKDNCRRTLQQRTLAPLSVVPSKKVISDIGIRMNLFSVLNTSAVEQSIRLEVEVRSLQEQELARLRRQLQRIQSTASEIRSITDTLH